MGKKAKKKIRNTHKEKRTSSGSQEAVPVQSKSDADVVADGHVALNGNAICSHVLRGVDLSKVSGQIGSQETWKCEDCRESLLDRKGKSKPGKKGKGGLWICLQCGHVSCGGVGLPTTPQCHAIRHSKQSRHPCVIQLKNPSLCWCFPCNSLVPVKKEKDDGSQNDVLLEVSKLIKGVSEASSVDAEDVRSGTGSAGDATMVGPTDSLVSVSDRKSGYVVRGLSNLGNTCFFNSVMQNLLAMDQLRDFFMKLDHFVGPLTIALKKLFNETNFEPDSKYGINPRNLFGCICSKCPQFRGYQQQDSHELLRCLLDGLCTEELNMRKSAGPSKDRATSNPDPTFIDSIFGGQLSSTVSCMDCKHSSVVYEPFLDLSLPIPSKKPPSKKVPPVSRSKKTKLPLRQEARKVRPIRGKGKKDSEPVLLPSTTGTSKIINSSSLASDSVLEEESLDSLEPPLDDVGPDTVSIVLEPNSHEYNTSDVQISESMQISQDDKLQNSAESQCQVVSTMVEPKQNSNLSKGSISENDLPLQQASEALLVPCNEDSSTAGEIVSKDCEASSSLSGRQQDALDFVGFQDVLNESEMKSVPILDDKNSQQFEVKQTGSLAGNSSESDHDEVDDRDAPLSINTCLAYFTKSELLSENAWHCENCSKTLRRRQEYSEENSSKATLKRKINGVQLQNQNDTLRDLLNNTVEHRSSENGYPKSELESNIEGDMDLIESNFDDQASGSYNVDVEVHGSSDSDDEDDQSDEGDKPRVKVMTNATKRILINKAPRILTIHLKRFRQDNRGRLNKLSGHVIFHDKIDVSPYMSPSSNEESKTEYQLLGIVEHSGTMRGGHYVAYVRGNKRREKTEQDSDDHTWFYASDSHVREVSIKEVFKSEAYILFYEKI